MKRTTRLLALTTLLATACLLQRPHQANAQQQPRFGIAFNTMLSTADGLGLGIRGRVSAPINRDLSFAADVGLTGFVLRGRDDATYVFDPQVSAIVTLPARGRGAPYILGGIGGYITFSSNGRNAHEGGPTLHGGIGWVRTLNDTTIFYELDPALIIGEESVDLVLPLRVGIIF
ncbi:MAG: hypothetical protein ACE5G0_06400 [Rhodothermales bacterium]